MCTAKPLADEKFRSACHRCWRSLFDQSRYPRHFPGLCPFSPLRTRSAAEGPDYLRRNLSTRPNAQITTRYLTLLRFRVGPPWTFTRLLSPTHLWREVRYRPAVGAHGRAGAVEIAQPEIGELYFLQAAWPRQQDVVQLHVAVADVLIVRVAHPADNLK